jgi:hypothetical protein
VVAVCGALLCWYSMLRFDGKHAFAIREVLVVGQPKRAAFNCPAFRFDKPCFFHREFLFALPLPTEAVHCSKRELHISALHSARAYFPAFLPCLFLALRNHFTLAGFVASFLHSASRCSTEKRHVQRCVFDALRVFGSGQDRARCSEHVRACRACH